MKQAVKAIYTGGVLEPVEPIPLRDGQRVVVTFETDESPAESAISIVDEAIEVFREMDESAWRELAEASKRRPMFGSRSIA